MPFQATPGEVIDYQHHLPVEYLTNAVKTLSDATDKGVAEADLLNNGVLKIKHPDTEHWESRFQEVKNKYQPKIDELTEKMKSDPARFMQHRTALRDLNRQLMEDASSGDIANLEKAASNYDSYRKELAKQYDDKRITGEEYQAGLLHAQKQVDTDKPNYIRLGDNIKVLDYLKSAGDLVKADGHVVKYDEAKGAWINTTTKEIEQVSYPDVYNMINTFAKSDPTLQSYVHQRAELGLLPKNQDVTIPSINGSPEVQIKGFNSYLDPLIHQVAKSMSYSKTKEEHTVKENGVWAQKDSQNFTNQQRLEKQKHDDVRDDIDWDRTVSEKLFDLYKSDPNKYEENKKIGKQIFSNKDAFTAGNYTIEGITLGALNDNIKGGDKYTRASYANDMLAYGVAREGYKAALTSNDYKDNEDVIKFGAAAYNTQQRLSAANDLGIKALKSAGYSDSEIQAFQSKAQEEKEKSTDWVDKTALTLAPLMGGAGVVMKSNYHVKNMSNIFTQAVNNYYKSQTGHKLQTLKVPDDIASDLTERIQNNPSAIRVFDPTTGKEDNDFAKENFKFKEMGVGTTGVIFSVQKLDTKGQPIKGTEKYAELVGNTNINYILSNKLKDAKDPSTSEFVDELNTPIKNSLLYTLEQAPKDAKVSLPINIHDINDESGNSVKTVNFEAVPLGNGKYTLEMQLPNSYETTPIDGGATFTKEGIVNKLAHINPTPKKAK